MAKKVLVVDDSALMRRVLCDIINSDERFHVVDRATNGLEAFDLLSRNTYDAVVLDENMPKMTGLQLLEQLQKYKISARVVMASNDTKEGAKVTLDALELGALDFIHKPDNAANCREDSFRNQLINILWMAVNSRPPVFESTEQIMEERKTAVAHRAEIERPKPVRVSGDKIVAIASSTGGPKALQQVIPKFPADLNAPVLVVQHMPKGFTASLAERLNEMSEIGVKEAEEGEEVKKGMCYIARGGMHMNVARSATGKYVIRYSDEPAREGVKPCANYMYESLTDSHYDCVVCVVMTGMGADGTEGIRNLKNKKKVYVISQDQETCTVYGMPKSVMKARLSDEEVPLGQLAQEVIAQVGVTS